jgi:hypothetical protein
VSRSEPALVAPPGKTPAPKFSILPVDMKRHRHPHVAAGRRQTGHGIGSQPCARAKGSGRWRTQRRVEVETVDGTSWLSAGLRRDPISASSRTIASRVSTPVDRQMRRLPEIPRPPPSRHRRAARALGGPAPRQRLSPRSKSGPAMTTSRSVAYAVPPPTECRKRRCRRP